LPLVAGAVGLLALRHRFAAAAALAATVSALCVPLVARNHAVNGTWLPSRGGLSLYVGNSTHSDALLPDHDVDLLIPVAAMAIRSQRPDVAVDSADYEPIQNRILT